MEKGSKKGPLTTLGYTPNPLARTCVKKLPCVGLLVSHQPHQRNCLLWI